MAKRNHCFMKLMLLSLSLSLSLSVHRCLPISSFAKAQPPWSQKISKEWLSRLQPDAHHWPVETKTSKTRPPPSKELHQVDLKNFKLSFPKAGLQRRRGTTSRVWERKIAISTLVACTKHRKFTDQAENRKVRMWRTTRAASTIPASVASRLVATPVTQAT